MDQNRFKKMEDHAVRMHKAYEQRYVYGLSTSEISRELGVSSVTIRKYLRTFEAENPEISEEMKKKSIDVTLDDYARLQQEVARLSKELKREKLRADFYEEMVAFGEEVYGIDLKKVGTK